MSQEDYLEEDHSNRLSATMAMLSETYPIVVYYEKAIACGLPEHFMDLRFLPDKWGRVPCKREAMDWYLENGPINERTKTTADVKFEEDLETVERRVKSVTVDVDEQGGGSDTKAGMEYDTVNMK